MFFTLLLFIVFCRQSICYPPNLCSVKCLTKTYCGITDTGAYTCLPCPEGNLCPGDGYTYTQPRVNNKKIFSSSGGSYIVSHINKGGERYLKRLRRIVKIAKVGLKIAVIAKTGGVAALKKAAVSKAKELAIKKGLQCLKNGLSNFCKGKKNIIIKPKPNSKSRIINLKPKAKITSLKTKTKILNLKPKAKISSLKTKIKIKTKPTKLIPRTKAKSKKNNLIPRTKATPKKNNLGKKVKPNPSNRPITNKQPCTNIFDRIANRVNNATGNIIKRPVNKGRDWLKRNVGGNSPTCVVRIQTKRPSNLRGVAKKRISSPNSKDNNNLITVTSRPSKNRLRKSRRSNRLPVQQPKTQTQSRKGHPPTRVPTTIPVTNDDSVQTINPTIRITRRPSTIPVTNDDSVQTLNPTIRITHRPTTIPVTNDDSVQTMNPTIRINRISRITRRPTTIPVTNDDSVQTMNPTIRIIRQQPVRTSRIPTSMPITSDDSVSTSRPSKIRLRKSRRPKTTLLPTVSTRITTLRPSIIIHNVRPITSIPTRIPTVIPSKNPTRIPSVIPSANPTKIPTFVPTIIPSTRPSSNPTRVPSAGSPTMIPISWSMFSIAPTVFSNIPPTRVPTFSMFRLITGIPTSARPISKPTPSPSMIRIVTTSQTITPTSLQPTTNPTPAPSLYPSIITPIPSQLPSTNSPSQATIGLNSGTITNKESTPTITIASVIACIVVILIMIGIFAYCMNKNKAKMSPYDIWSNYYSEKNVPVQAKSQSIVDEDIHYFYNKNQRPSINPNPVFTPHLSANPSYRNSQLGGQLGSQRNSIRMSIPHRKLQTNYAL